MIEELGINNPLSPLKSPNEILAEITQTVSPRKHINRSPLQTLLSKKILKDLDTKKGGL
jgi:hypothetical protein